MLAPWSHGERPGIDCNFDHDFTGETFWYSP